MPLQGDGVLETLCQAVYQILQTGSSSGKLLFFSTSGGHFPVCFQLRMACRHLYVIVMPCGMLAYHQRVIEYDQRIWYSKGHPGEGGERVASYDEAMLSFQDSEISCQRLS